MNILNNYCLAARVVARLFLNRRGGRLAVFIQQSKTPIIVSLFSSRDDICKSFTMALSQLAPRSQLATTLAAFKIMFPNPPVPNPGPS